ncbi:MAG: hypothetical protein HXS46_14885 [Theionarchaea archaeon]|nr:hypothetical protein [Theionarchaea archaeon]
MEDMTVLTEEQLRNMPFIFQKCMLDSPRVRYAELGRKAGISRKTAKDHLISLMGGKILYPPQMRAKICSQVAEFVYLLKVNDIEAFIPVLEAEKYVFYYCLCTGPYNLIFMSYKPLDLSHLEGYQQTVASGIRSNYCVPPVSNQSYQSAYQKILERCNRKIDPSMFDMKFEDFKWTKELWDLYCDLKYDLRIDFTPLVKKYEFKFSTFYERINQLMMYCDIYVPLYPLEEPKYTFFYFLIKTKYQEFVVESFGELPVFSTHIRVKDSILSYVPLPHGGERDFFRNIIPFWQRRGIIDSYDLSIAYWSDRIHNHPGMPPPPPPPPPPSGIIPPERGDSSTGKEYVSFM